MLSGGLRIELIALMSRRCLSLLLKQINNLEIVKRLPRNEF